VEAPAVEKESPDVLTIEKLTERLAACSDHLSADLSGSHNAAVALD